jgi:serine/threonine-protein kinase
MGSPLYMSPEQLQATKAVDARTDIWALGIILFELVTGRVPFATDVFSQLVLSIVTAPTPSLRSLRPDVPVTLEPIVQRCLEKDREHRYANVAELAEALAVLAPKRALPSVEKISRIIRNAGLASSAARPLPQSTVDNPPRPGAGTAAAWGQTAPGANKKTTTLAVGLLGTLTLAAVVAAGVATKGFGLRRSPPSAAAVAPPAVTSPQSPPSATQTPPVATLVDLGTPTPPASAAPSASTAAPPPAPRPAVAPTPVGRPAGGNKAPAPAPVCSAVPYLDSDGNTHFKQVCK